MRAHGRLMLRIDVILFIDIKIYEVYNVIDSHNSFIYMTAQLDTDGVYNYAIKIPR